MSYLVIALLALIVTAGYTGDLEMAWLLAMLLVPLYAIAMGGLLAFAGYRLRRFDRNMALYLVLFSLAVHTALLMEEMTLGWMRKAFHTYTSSLNEKLRASGAHRVSLGNGRQLYFESPFAVTEAKAGDVFNINFEYQGSSTVLAKQLLSQAETWMQQQGYKAACHKIHLQADRYQKGFFALSRAGRIVVDCEMKPAAIRDNNKITRMMLEAGIEQQAWHFKQSGVVFG